MNKLNILSCILLIAVFCSTSCREDSIEETTTTTTTETPVLVDMYQPEVNAVQAKVIGHVVDENQSPIESATIKLGNLSTTTNAFGHFFFENVEMNSLGTFITVEKAGYFLGSRKFYPKENSDSRVKIQLIEQNFDQSFDATTGGVLNAEGMVAITFGPNVIANADGSLYTGIVTAATTYLNPTENKTLDEMPGDLSALSLENNVGVLNTYGMVNVELQSANGSPLNIAEGETALIEMNVPGTIQANAPSTIPLWSFNETHAIWVEEGEATLGASKYTGTVSHFSWWNCDMFNDRDFIDFTLIDHQGLPLPNVLTQLILANQTTFTGSAYSDSSGFLNGLVPMNEPMILNVFDYCGNIIYTQNIGPFTTATSLGNIQILNNVTASTITITGELLDCYSAPLQNGIVVINIDNILVYEYIDTNPFTISIPTCSSTTNFSVYGVNSDNFEQSITSTYSVNTNVNLGQITACGNTLTNYFHYIVDGNQNTTYDASAIVIDSLGTGNPQTTSIFGSGITTYNGLAYPFEVSINMPDTIVGSYYNLANLYISDPVLLSNSLNGSNINTSIDTLNITQFGSSGDQEKPKRIGQ